MDINADDRPVIVKVGPPFSGVGGRLTLHIERLPTTPGHATGAEISQETGEKLILAVAEGLDAITRAEGGTPVTTADVFDLLIRCRRAEEFARRVAELGNPDEDSVGFQERRVVRLGDLIGWAREALNLDEE